MTTFAKAVPKEVFDPATGEVFVAYETSKIIKTRVREFDKLFIEDMDDLRNIKYVADYHILMYIAKNMEFGTNELLLGSARRERMAEYAKIHVTQVSKSLKRLVELGIIKCNKKRILMNPKYMVRGTDKDFYSIEFEYENFK
jgi:transcription initiation factor IIE alpha subunit